MQPYQPTLEEINEKLGLENPDDFWVTLKELISNVYLINADRNDEDLGDDSYTFGQLTYRNIKNKVIEVFRDFDGVSTNEPTPSLSLYTPGPTLKFYRGGNDEDFLLDSYVLKDDSTKKQEILIRNGQQAEQLQLQLDDDQETIPEPLDMKEWFVVHSGNQELGLTKLSVGAAYKSTSGAYCWAFTFDIDLDNGDTGGVTVITNPDPTIPERDGQLKEPEIDVSIKGQTD